MAQTSDPYTSSSGPNPGGICAPNPQDEVAILGNIISRVANIEKVLAQLVGSDISAIQLGDITNDGGGIDYATDTWVTEAGTIANPDPAVIAQILEDARQNQKLLIGPNHYSNPGGITSWLIVRPAATALNSSNGPNLSDNVYQHGTAFTTTRLADGRIDIIENGLYEADVHLNVAFGVSPGSNRMHVYHSRPDVGIIDEMVDEEIRASATDYDPRNVLSAHLPFEAVAGDYLIIVFTGVTAMSGSFYQMGRVEIKKLTGAIS